MNVFRPIGTTGLAWRAAARGLEHREVWHPVLVLATLDILFMMVVLGFHYPLLVAWARPLVEALGGEGATHYPAHLYALPRMFEQASIFSRTIVLPLVAGAMCLRFAVLFGLVSHEIRPSLTWRHVFLLIMIGVIATAIPAAVEAMLAAGLRRQAPQLLHHVPAFLALFSVVTLAVLVYCVPSIVLRGQGLLGALREGWMRFEVLLVPSLLVVAVPILVLQPLAGLVPRADLAPLSLRPELTILLVTARIAIEMVVIVFIVGASTRLFVTQRSQKR